ncbi:phosphotransferase [Candidatus Saccharibacteria bacterium]|nr:phosphotransferase [Candidatus Saccharibacteria bacterium]
MSDSFERRIDFDGDISDVVDRVAADYGLGAVHEHSLIEAGFQDYNVRAGMTSGEYLIKIFAQSRGEGEAQRYTDIIEAAIAAGVNHPPLLKDGNNQSLHVDIESGLKLAVMGFVPGATYKELGRAPSTDELKKIAEQAVKINSISMKPVYLFDTWAVPNIHWMYDQVKDYLDEATKILVQQAMNLYDAIPAELPTAFVHGDIIQTNTILGDDDKIYIIDFAVANIYPRIQELAVMAANLMHDGKMPLPERVDSVLAAYLSAGGKPLNNLEQKHLLDYATASAAMECMGGYYERYISKDDSDEVGYWIQVGKQGLEEAPKS